MIFPSQRSIALGAAVVVSILLTSYASASGPQTSLAPRKILDKSLAITPDWRHRTDMILVKFHDDLPIRSHDGMTLDLSGVEVNTVGSTGATGAAGPTAHAMELIEHGSWRAAHDLPPHRLQAMRLTAQANLNQAIADPRSEFYYTLPAGVSVDEAIAAFNSLDVVELASPLDLPAPSPRAGSERTAMLLPPSYQNAQGYLNAAPTGIGATLAWLLLGVRGDGVRVADIEYSFNANHADLPPITVLTVGTPTPPWEDNNHGTAVLGELGSRNNGWGTTGIAHEAAMHFSHSRVNGVNNIATAIYRCVNAFDAGDVVLLEAQAWGPNSVDFPADCFGCVPVEWVYSNFTAITIAVGNGIHVVEAGANGQQNLDDPIYSQGNSGHWPFQSGVDSGAIIVGAGHAPSAFGGSGTARSRMWYSNYGSRVNVQAWGQAVWTTGYGSAYSVMGQNYWYTAGFSGTSSASPIVAGAVTLISSYHQQTLSKAMPAAAMRDLLVETGSPQTNGQYPATQHIGPLPDVYAAIGAIELPVLCPADLNGDQIVDADDLGLLLQGFGLPGGPDLNRDGVCDADDLGLLLAAFGDACS